MRFRDMMAHKPGVALVGRCLSGNEHLGIAYLKAALMKSGISVQTYFINTPDEMLEAASTIVRRSPKIVGISLLDGASSILLLAFGELLRAKGFTGHITMGGQFATLASDWLMSRYEWIDSVVRFAGENALVSLYQRLVSGKGAHGAPGVTTRSGEGPPAEVMHTPLHLVPKRESHPRILQHRAAHMMATRGCRGRCGYCSPAALQTAEFFEGRRAGFSSRELRKAQVGGVRRRSVDAVADEMSILFHHHDVRYFYFVDEHLLPYEEDAALSYLEAFKHALDERGVKGIGIGAMLRADRLTPKVAEAFVDAGLIRAFIGLEFGTKEEAKRFGRTPPCPNFNSLLHTLQQRGVVTISNIMLVHPYATESSVSKSLDLLETLPAGLFEISRMMVYHGTKLHRQLDREGRLTGNPIRYGYPMLNHTMERFAAVTTRLRVTTFHDYSVAHKTHDAALHVALSSRLAGKERTEQMEELAAISASLRRIYVDTYRSALSLAASNAPYSKISTLIAETQNALGPIDGALTRVQRDLMQRESGLDHWLNPFRAVASASLFTFVMAGQSGCFQSSDSPLDHSSSTIETDSATTASTDSETLDTGTSDIGDPVETEDTATSDIGDTVETDACTDFQYAVEIKSQAKTTLETEFPCAAGWITRTNDNPLWEANFRIFKSGEHLTNCSGIENPPAISKLEDDIEETANRLDLPCSDTLNSVDFFGSDASSQQGQAVEAIQAACQDAWDSHFIVALDSEGTVQRVYYSETVSWPYGSPADDEMLACIEKALVGLSFPCFADMSLCPEFIIIE